MDEHSKGNVSAAYGPLCDESWRLHAL
ncbi:hypothetical protein EMIT0111MI5_50073 [Burkholderia sp. IT-111MI5]